LQQPPRRQHVCDVEGRARHRARGRARFQQHQSAGWPCVSVVPRQQYASLYGPSKGDRLRLADTALIAQVERSLLTPGEEAIYGGGKSIRDGMGQIPGRRNADGALDTVI